MSLLGAPLVLHGIDVEQLAGRALADALRSSSTRLDPHEREDALAFLIGELWRESERFDAAFGATFSTVGYRTCRRRFSDWQRQRLGRSKWQFADRTYERERPTVLSLDAPDRDGGGRLDDALESQQGDDAADSLAAGSGLDALRGSTLDRDLALLRDAARRLARQ